MIEMQQHNDGRILEVRISGKISKADYEQHLPYVENLIVKLGKLSVLVDLRDFHGWEMGALWEDMKFDVRHFRDIDRVAFVGETRWQKAMATSCKPFTMAKVRFFTHDQFAQAREWVSGQNITQAAA
jgi:hypothetical protein